MTHVVCQPCENCKYTDCVVVCPVTCFYEGETMLYIHPDECIDCEACVPECPVEAIFPDSSVPAQWQSYIEINRTIFDKHSVDEAAGRGGAAAPATDAATELAEPLAASSTPSSEELDALRSLLAEVGDRKTSAADAVEKAVPLLEKLGVQITDE